MVQLRDFYGVWNGYYFSSIKNHLVFHKNNWENTLYKAKGHLYCFKKMMLKNLNPEPYRVHKDLNKNNPSWMRRHLPNNVDFSSPAVCWIKKKNYFNMFHVKHEIHKGRREEMERIEAMIGVLSQKMPKAALCGLNWRARWDFTTFPSILS